MRTPKSEAKHQGIEELIQMLQENTRLWRIELGACSTRAVEWQPFRHGHNIGALMLHMADVEGFWMEEIVASRTRDVQELELLRSTDTDPMMGRWPEAHEGWPLDRYYEEQDRIRARTLATLRELPSPDEQFEAHGDALTVRSIVTRLIAHEAYHAGQAMLHKIHHGWGGTEPQ